jgi:hypothetical protein
MTHDLDVERLTSIFFPHNQRRTAAVKSTGDRFAYYTTAQTAERILTSRKIWFRNAVVMNDFKEIDHGLECLYDAYRGPAGEAMDIALSSCFPELPDDVRALFNRWAPLIRTDSYLFCLSEHPAHEDARGRLSMWRAYGGSTGVALILNGAVMHASSNVLGAYSSPVFYGDSNEFAEELTSVARQIQAEAEYLRSLGKETVTKMVLIMLHFAVLCTKHPGFREEMEWRVIASPMLFPGGRRQHCVEVVREVPQLVVKVDLEDDPEGGLTGLALPQLIDRIIIGPCELPVVTAMAFQRLLADAGVPDAESRVVVTDIPLRHNT